MKKTKNIATLICSVFLINILSSTSVDGEVYSSRVSEIGNFYIVHEVDGAVVEEYFSRHHSPRPNNQLIKNGNLITILASGKSNQYEGAMAYLEKNGKIFNVRILKNAMVVLNEKDEPSWLRLTDCENICYHRINMYQLGPSTTKIEVIPEPEPEVVAEVIPEREPEPEVVVEVIPEREVVIQKDYESNLVIIGKSKKVLIIPGISDMHSTTILVGEGGNTPKKDDDFSKYKIHSPSGVSFGQTEQTK